MDQRTASRNEGPPQECAVLRPRSPSPAGPVRTEQPDDRGLRWMLAIRHAGDRRSVESEAPPRRLADVQRLNMDANDFGTSPHPRGGSSRERP